MKTSKRLSKTSVGIWSDEDTREDDFFLPFVLIKHVLEVTLQNHRVPHCNWQGLLWV